MNSQSLASMYRDGTPIDDICSAHGISPTTFYGRLRRLGIPRTRKPAQESSKSRIARLRAHVKEYLEAHPCEHCACDDWRVLQFDHIDPGRKAFTIGKVLRKNATAYISTLRLQMEIEKCRVLCANCHSLATAKQFGFWRASC